MSQENLPPAQDWEKLFDDLDNLYNEFLQKWRKGRDDFRYNTHYEANNKRVEQIISTAVRMIKSNTELKNEMFKDRDENYQYYMEATGFWVESLFYSYMSKMLRYLESKIDPEGTAP